MSAIWWDLNIDHEHRTTALAIDGQLRIVMSQVLKTDGTWFTTSGHTIDEGVTSAVVTDEEMRAAGWKKSDPVIEVIDTDPR